MFNVRMFRQRWVLGIFFVCSLVYFLSSIYKQSHDGALSQDPSGPRPRPAPFIWIPTRNISNNSTVHACRNSVQGKLLITDDRGYVCRREHTLVSGCCNTTAPLTRRFSCVGCRRSGCCALYEHCVSCCLQPQKQALLRRILNKASGTLLNLFASVTDHFELCLTKCRTSSQSVQHENSYRDPNAKYCYTDNKHMMTEQVPGKDAMVQDDLHPFGLPWLDSCYQETLLPTNRWPQVQERICDALAKKIEKQLEIPQRQQMIFELMGRDFVSKYFPDRQYDHAILQVPQMSTEVRTKLQRNAQNWLQNTLTAVCPEVGCSRPGYNDDRQCEEMQAFLQQTQEIIHTGLERHLYLQEQHTRAQFEEVKWHQAQQKSAEKQASEQRLADQAMKRLQRSNSIKGILRKTVTKSPTPTSSGKVPAYTYNVKGARLHLTSDPPVFAGVQSDSVGRCLVALLQRDPRRFASVATHLHGRQLSPSLREYVWLDVLLAGERARQRHADVEQLVRQRFAQSVSSGVSELGIRKATHSPITTLINNALIEIYDITPGLQIHLQNNKHMKEAGKALNILYVFDRSYEPYLVHRLFPIQLALQTDSGQGEHVYELAMFLHLLNRSCFPPWPAVFTAARAVLGRLRDADPQLHGHLKAIAQVRPEVKPKEFLQHLLHEERKKADELLPAQTGSDILHGDDSREILADPLIFLRKWIGEGFVGVLDTQAAIFVWDQFFLQKWSVRPIEDTCLALLLLLRQRFMAADDFASMKKVFFDEPCMLYTLDIQKAWVHIQGDKLLSEVPALNRQLLVVKPEEEEDEEEEDVALPPMVVTLPAIGIKHLRLEIVVSALCIKKTPWLSTLENTSLRLLCTFSSDDDVLSSSSSLAPPVFTSIDQDREEGSRTYIIVFPSEVFLLKEQDVEEKDVSPSADLQVQCVRSPNAWTDAGADADVAGPSPECTLGSARLALYQRPVATPGGERADWRPLVGERFYSLTPVATDTSGESMIGGSSRLRATVFDPNDEGKEEVSPPERAEPRRVLPPPPPVIPQATPTPLPRRPEKPPTPAVCRQDEPFDIYIDCVRNIPDNASIMKVTGRLFKMAADQTVPDILAYPELSSPARSPRFQYRQTVDVQGSVGAETLLLLRAYTIDCDNHQIVIIGSCMLELFNEEGQLKVGGHGLQLYNGMVGKDVFFSSVTQNSLDGFPRVSACLLYFRLMAHTDEEDICPSLDDGFFTLHASPLNQSERNVAHSYANDDRFPKTVGDMIVTLQAEQKVTDGGEPMAWLQERLDKSHLNNKPAENLDITRAVNYHVDVGLTVQFIRAYGLAEEGLYVQCFARLVLGSVASSQLTTEEGHGGKDYKLTTLKHDYSSPQKAPRWLDQPKTIQPHCDAHSYLLVQLYGLKTLYTPHPEGSGPGTVTRSDGTPLALEDDDIIGWAIVPLFESKCVLSGKHHVPIFKGRTADADLMTKLSTELPELILSAPDSTAVKQELAALEVHVWDGHFTKEELPTELEPLSMLLGSVEEREKYRERETGKGGKKMSAFVIASHNGKLTNDSGEDYERERDRYEDVLGKTYYNLMESALMAAGDGPL